MHFTDIESMFLRQIRYDREFATENFEMWKKFIEYLFTTPYHSHVMFKYTTKDFVRDTSDFREFCDFIDGNGFTVEYISDSRSIDTMLTYTVRIRAQYTSTPITFKPF